MSRSNTSAAPPADAIVADDLATIPRGTPPLRILRLVRSLLESGQRREALRQIDRAIRTLPQHRAVIAPIYAALLADQGDLESALMLLNRAAETDTSPGIAAAIVNTLLRLQNHRGAAEQLELALKHRCLEQDGALHKSARRLLRSAGHVSSGWVGVTQSLELIGEVARTHAGGLLEIRGGDGSVLLQHQIGFSADGPSEFLLNLPPIAEQQALQVFVGGAPLRGSGLMYPPQFELDGRATTQRGLVIGWARLQWAPHFKLHLLVEDEFGAQLRLRTRRDAARGWKFRFDPIAAGIKGGRISIRAILPDGSTELIPDAPLLLEQAAEIAPISQRTTDTGATARSASRRRGIDVIIPVYLGRLETLACIHAVMATTGAGVRIVVVDDASPDLQLAHSLDELAAARKITLLRNASNLGFPSSVNRALKLHPSNDAVVLNADTVVFGNWLLRLRTAAYSAPDTGTATPMTNSGTVASYPAIEGYQCSVEQAAQFDQFAAIHNKGVTAEIPVGVGFCLYLRRDCLNQIGLLDARTFGKGYGEESDLCMRARDRGWKHVLAADVYVFHAGSSSFGRRRAALLERSGRLLNLRHPGYDALVREFGEANSLLPIRRQFDEHRLVGLSARIALLIVPRLSGGVDRFMVDHCKKLRARGLLPLILMPGENKAHECWLRTEDSSLNDLRYETVGELPALKALLTRLDIQKVELHHFLDLDSEVIELVMALGVPYDAYIHDYVWICPRVTLIDGSGRYCGEPPVSRCEVCIQRNGSLLNQRISVSELRRRSTRWLEGAHAVIVPSSDVAKRLASHFPKVPTRVKAWEVPPVPHQAPTPTAGRIRVALIGAIGQHKGYDVLLACARDAAARQLELEFVLIGHTQHDTQLIRTGRIFVTGRYGEDEIQPLIQREAPHVLLVASVWPETWCYTLTHALSSGIPIVAFDIGAVAERLRDIGQGVLLPLATAPGTLNDQLIAAASSNRSGAVQHAAAAPAAGRALARPLQNLKQLVNDGSIDPMKSKSHGDAGRSQSSASASAQVITLPKGLYFFSVGKASPAPTATAGNLLLPAVQVTPGPGIGPDQIEFISGPDTYGTWLYNTGDMLVAKVTGDNATLVLTSIRGADGTVLDIGIEKLDGSKRQVAGPAPAPALPVAPPEPPAVTGLKLGILAHVRSRGDMDFVGAAWAGRVAPGLWIEAFSVKPMERFSAKDIEYKALTGSGFETPWLSDGALCGTRGMGVPLVGFSLRLKPGPETAGYDCEYSGYFRSGTIAGPVRNGTPCRSPVAGDPLEGIQVRLVERAPTAASPGKRPPQPAATAVEPSSPAPLGPRFSKFREADAPPPPGKTAPSRRPKPAASAKASKGAPSKAAEEPAAEKLPAKQRGLLGRIRRS